MRSPHVISPCDLPQSGLREGRSPVDEMLAAQRLARSPQLEIAQLAELPPSPRIPGCTPGCASGCICGCISHGQAVPLPGFGRPAQGYTVLTPEGKGHRAISHHVCEGIAPHEEAAVESHLHIWLPCVRER